MDVKKLGSGTSCKESSGKENKIAINIGLAGMFLLLFLCLGAYLLLQLKVFDVFGSRLQLYKKISLGHFFFFGFNYRQDPVEMLITKRSQSKALRYNLIRAVRLLRFYLLLLLLFPFSLKIGIQRQFH